MDFVTGEEPQIEEGEPQTEEQKYEIERHHVCRLIYKAHQNYLFKFLYDLLTFFPKELLEIICKYDNPQMVVSLQESSMANRLLLTVHSTLSKFPFSFRARTLIKDTQTKNFCNLNLSVVQWNWTKTPQSETYAICMFLDYDSFTKNSNYPVKIEVLMGGYCIGLLVFIFDKNYNGWIQVCSNIAPVEFRWWE
jgi:hypothetical protein